MARPRSQKVVFVNLPDLSTVPSFTAVKGAFGGKIKDPAIQAMIRMVLLRQSECRTHEIMQGATAEDRCYEAGGAAALGEVAMWLYLLADNKAEQLPEGVKLHFGWKDPKKNAPEEGN